jgi:hypothetical protein
VPAAYVPGNDLLINPDQAMSLKWSSTNATACNGISFNTGGATNNAGTGITVPPPGTITTYTIITCTGLPDPKSDSVTIHTRTRPNLKPSTVSLVPSATFDPITGAYTSINAKYAVLNTGEADAAATVTAIDFDGTAATKNEPIINGGGSTGVNTIALGGNLLFGTHDLTVSVDKNNIVTESNETDNTYTATLTVPPPNPGLVILSNPGLIRVGKTADISWSMSATYPMNCSVIGYNLVKEDFDPSVTGPTGTKSTGPLKNKGVYRIICVEPITNTTFKAETTVEVVPTFQEI